MLDLWIYCRWCTILLCRWVSTLLVKFCTVQVLLGLEKLPVLRNMKVSTFQWFWSYTNRRKYIETGEWHQWKLLLSYKTTSVLVDMWACSMTWKYKPNSSQQYWGGLFYYEAMIISSLTRLTWTVELILQKVKFSKKFSTACYRYRHQKQKQICCHGDVLQLYYCPSQIMQYQKKKI